MRLIPPPSCAEVMVRRASVPGDEQAAGAARRFLRAALADWAGRGLPQGAGFDERLLDDATLLISELVTNAVVHAGTAVDIVCVLDDHDAPGLVIEVADRHPDRVLCGRAEPAPDGEEGGRGLYLVAALSDVWGVTYHRDRKAVWCRLGLADCPERSSDVLPVDLPVDLPDTRPGPLPVLAGDRPLPAPADRPEPPGGGGPDGEPRVAEPAAAT